MNEKTFQIMYQALVEIAASPTFFGREKAMAQIAKKALQDIADSSTVLSNPNIGDTWEEILPDGNTFSHYWDGDRWVGKELKLGRLRNE